MPIRFSDRQYPHPTTGLPYFAGWPTPPPECGSHARRTSASRAEAVSADRSANGSVRTNTLPKKWRDKVGIGNGGIVKIKKEGNKVVIEP